HSPSFFTLPLLDALPIFIRRDRLLDLQLLLQAGDLTLQARQVTLELLQAAVVVLLLLEQSSRLRIRFGQRLYRPHVKAHAHEDRSEEHTSELQSRFDLVC